MALTKIGKEGITGISNSSDATAITIDSSENVGIGTASPSKPLTVVGGDFSTVLLDNSNSSHGTQILFQANGTSNTGADIQMSDAGGLKIRTLAVEPLTLATSASAGSPSNAMVISTAGEITKPLQPAFLVAPSSEQSNLSINAFTQIAFGTEVFDIGSNFASNIFTAPVTGKYALQLSLRVDNLDIDTTYYDFRIVTSNRDYKFFQGMAQFDADGYSHAITISCVADMDASDTAQVKVDIPNAGASQADVNANSFFSGMLIG